jgi:hypothetical protein
VGNDRAGALVAFADSELDFLFFFEMFKVAFLDIHGVSKGAALYDVWLEVTTKVWSPVFRLKKSEHGFHTESSKLIRRRLPSTNGCSSCR